MAARRSVLRRVRWDSVTTEAVVVLGWLIALLLLVGEPVRRWVTGEPPTARVDADAVGLAAYLDGTVPFRVLDAGAGDRLLLLAPNLLAVVALGIGAWFVVRLLRSVAVGDPFTGDNVRRLRILATLLIAAPVVVAALQGVATALVLSEQFDDPGFAIAVQPWWLPAGLLAAALAQAFATGMRQRRELEGLV